MRSRPVWIRWGQWRGTINLPKARKRLSHGPWDTCAGLFIPSKILDLAIKVLRNPPAYITKFVALLAWVPESDVLSYFDNKTKEECVQLLNDQRLQQWSEHPLYKTKKKNELERMCRDLKSSVTPNVSKHELVKCISEKKRRMTTRVAHPLQSISSECTLTNSTHY